MNISMISFTERGGTLAEAIKEKIDRDEYQVTCDVKCAGVSNAIDKPLSEWTKEKFRTEDAIIFIGAAGIAVRTIAPYIKSKTTDPAILVIDEAGSYCIPLLSGHIGGANELALYLTECLKPERNMIPVITTATDLNHKWAVDVFARKNGLHISDMQLAKNVSARLLAGEKIRICLEDGGAYTGKLPDELILDTELPDIYIGIRRLSDKIWEDAAENAVRRKCLHLVPRAAYLGIGCKKGTSLSQIETAVFSTLETHKVDFASVTQAASIDLKAQEEGILEFCEKYHLDYQVYSAEELKKAPGIYDSSEFVSRVTGVDNVCERSAIRASMKCPEEVEASGLMIHKTICQGVTVALAVREWSVSFK